VLDDVFKTGESVCVEHALSDERFERRQSILNLELQTIMCSPLRTHVETIGVIYVDSKLIQPVDTADILRLFEILAGQAAIAIQNASLYEDLRKTYDELKEANEQIIRYERMAIKGELAAEVSHELKNLVAVVILNLQKLERSVGNIPSEEIRSIVDKAIEGVRRIQGFSQNLLTGSQASPKLLPRDINTIGREFLEFVKALPKFKGNNFSASLEEAVPRIRLDVDQIQQVLLNLVNNAVEAFPGAAIELRTELDWSTGSVKLIVRDNGPGIDESVRKRLFSERITTKPDGHGYGLSICRQIMEHHGGHIEVVSTKGNGAAFVMTFPVSANGQSDPGVSQNEMTEGGKNL
jgi:signal transduction histidine kinase